MSQNKRVFQWNLDGDYVMDYESVSQAGEITGIGRRNIGHAIDIHTHTAGGFMWTTYDIRKSEEFVREVEIKPLPTLLDEIRKVLSKSSYTVEDLADRFNVAPKIIRTNIEELKGQKFLLNEESNGLNISDTPQQGGQHSFDESMWQGDIMKFGFTSDNHLCSYEERLDVLNLIYDLCASEGVSIVLNGGNWIDGESRFNKNEIHTRGMGNQIQYAVDNYPYREGIETWFVSGDDHEGWYSQREGINIGEYFQMKREQTGRYDLKHLGYVEADINLNEEGRYKEDTWMRVMHAGGGSAYAVSYAPQKIIESLQGGEKPTLLFIGHYHKLSYNIIRNVHTVQMGTTMNQSIFMRKRKIEAHVGGGIVEIRRDRNGVVNRCKVDFITAFDNKFYLGDDKYWKTTYKGQTL